MQLDEHIEAFEYDEEKKPIGRGRLYLIRNETHGWLRPYGLIEDVWVDEKHRDKGIGKKIVARLIHVAENEGCYKVIATSRLERNKVHKLYKDLGFEKWGYEFRMDL